MRVLLFLIFFLPLAIFAQPDTKPEKDGAPAEKVEIKPGAQDVEIQKRLEDILKATGWFSNPAVEVKEGIVFLYGRTETDESRKWASNLARNTQNVVAVVNKMEVQEPSVWDFTLVHSILENRWRGFMKAIPSIFIGLFILAIAFGFARLTTTFARKLLKDRFRVPLLRDVIARGIGIFIFLMGVYLIFEMANLTGAALTIISGTGLLGIILGIAFRDITENFLASILLSIYNPFQNGDLVEIAGYMGYVQGLTMRVTLLMSIDGNHIQIPNAVVYKSNIRNYTSNPNRRDELFIAVAYQNSISRTQEIAVKVLQQHDAVLKDPKPTVLADSVDKGAVTLRISFWLDSSKHSWQKVRSSVIRHIKRAFQEANILMPEDLHKVTFPSGIEVQMTQKEKHISPSSKEQESHAVETESTTRTEAQVIEQQAKKARPPEEGKNLLNPKKTQEDV